MILIMILSVRQMLVLLLIFNWTYVLANPLDLQKKTIILPYKGQGFLSIFNRSDKIEYYRATASRIEINDQGDVERIEIKNPRELGLLVVPVNIKMQPMQKRKVRVVSLKPSPGGTKHTYYSIDFDHITKESQERIKQIEKDKEQTSAMKVYISSKAEKSVIVDVGSKNDYNPRTNAIVDIYDKDKDEEGQVIKKNRVVITNTGNVVLWLTGFETCKKNGTCQALTWFKLIYPGEKYRYVLEDGVESVRYVELFGSKETKRFIKIP